MNKKIFFLLIFFLTARPLFAFLLPAQTIFENNINQRKYLKSAKLSHTIYFLESYSQEGSPTQESPTQESPTQPFSCEETLYFSSPNILRADYICNAVHYSFLRKGENKKTIYNKQISTLDASAFHFWPSLFLVTDFEALTKTLAHFQFIEIESHQSIAAAVSLVRSGRIEKSLPSKKEKNVALLITSGSSKLWLEKDLFLPQKIEYENNTFIFKNYTEILLTPEKSPPKNQRKKVFIYPKDIEIQKAGVSHITLETHFETLQINPTFQSNFFNSSTIVQKNKTAFPEESNFKEVLEKFILEYR